MQKLLKDETFFFEHPQNEAEPFEVIRQLKFAKTGSGITKGTGGKRKLVQLLLSLGLNITDAARHPNCTSAHYFTKQLAALNPLPK